LEFINPASFWNPIIEFSAESR